MTSEKPEEIGGHRTAITLCVILATLMQALDTTIANVELPYMQGTVSASQEQIDWVLTSYIVAAAIMTPPTGFLAGKFGIKRLFMVSIGGFTVASMLCGMAQRLIQIVLFRVMQGAFGGTVSWAQLPAYVIGEVIGGMLGGLAYVGVARVRKDAALTSLAPEVPGDEDLSEQPVSGATS